MPRLVDRALLGPGAEPAGRRAGSRDRRRRADRHDVAERDLQPAQRATAASRSPSRRWRRICALAGEIPVDAVLSCAFGSPYEGDIPPKAVAEMATAAARPRLRRHHLRRHHRHGHAAPHRGGAPRGRHGRGAPPPRDPGDRARERLRGDAARDRSLRHLHRRARRIALRGRRRRQPGHRGARGHARRPGCPHRHLGGRPHRGRHPRRPSSWSGRCRAASPPSALARDWPGAPEPCPGARPATASTTPTP